MNERIEQLWDKAAQEAAAYPSGQNNSWETQVNFMEKFAELIVAHATECVRDVLRDENSELTYPAASQVQNRIKEYFGVEE